MALTKISNPSSTDVEGGPDDAEAAPEVDEVVEEDKEEAVGTDGVGVESTIDGEDEDAAV